jgi:GFO/IDH/MocA oxidoreductase family protein
MKRRSFLRAAAGSGATLWLTRPHRLLGAVPAEVRVGIIGLDTSHSVEFTRILNARGADASGVQVGAAAYRVTHAYPYGSRTIASSNSRIPRYVEAVRTRGVAIVDSIAALLDEVDAVLLETNDGRLHLTQALQVFEAGKSVFVDKPLAASLVDVLGIVDAAADEGVPMFSSSPLRFAPATVDIAEGRIGRVLGADTYSPAKLEPTHPDLFWYGIHGVESLFTVMGTGCRHVRRIYQDGTEVVVGEWMDGRIGTFRGTRTGRDLYGGTAFGEDGVAHLGGSDGYEPLVRAIVRFFDSGQPPVSAEETVEIYAFMQAAQVSGERGGESVDLAEVMDAAHTTRRETRG